MSSTKNIRENRIRYSLCIDEIGTVSFVHCAGDRFERGIGHFSVHPVEKLFDIPYDDWAKLAPGLVYVVDGKITRAPIFEPELLQWLEENKTGIK